MPERFATFACFWKGVFAISAMSCAGAWNSRPRKCALKKPAGCETCSLRWKRWTRSSGSPPPRARIPISSPTTRSRRCWPSMCFICAMVTSWTDASSSGKTRWISNRLISSRRYSSSFIWISSTYPDSFTCRWTLKIGSCWRTCSRNVAAARWKFTRLSAGKRKRYLASWKPMPSIVSSSAFA